MQSGRFILDQWQALTRFDAIIDVRSPSEFAEDHLPGAINCPVLDDVQRAQVGTLYTQSPFEARRLGAAWVAENIAGHLGEAFRSHDKSWRPLVYCWRGGMRSGSMVQVMRMVGWSAEQLQGGYKTYRRRVVQELQELPAGFRYRVLTGPTGSGKSRLLQALAEQGAQVLDLEALAAHRGSVLGALPSEAQPSQKTFETRLHAALTGFDRTRAVFVEAESRKIGSLQLPESLVQAMHARCQLHQLELPRERRVAFLLEEYAHYFSQPQQLKAHLARLTTLRGKDQVVIWMDMIDRQQWSTLVDSLLTRHYDPLYARSAAQREAGGTQAATIALQGADAMDWRRAAGALCAEEATI